MKKLKKIIAREGLIILLIIGLLFFSLFTDMPGIISGILFLSYPIYLLFRFIIWAIYTLKTSENVNMDN